jgi:acyl carrier protein
MATDPNEIAGRLLELLVRTGTSVPNDMDIRDIPIRDLDSLATLDFLLSAEKVFGVQLDPDALLDAHAFETVGSLADYIAASRSGAG